MATNENHLKLMFLLMLSCLWISFAAARDTLELGDTLNSSSYLVSTKRAFTLGFFHSGSTSNIYLGIWFTNDPKRIVWVGNRNAPVVNTAAVLTLETKGNFKILPQGGDAISLYSHQATNYTDTLFATLLDSGNFVLQELDSNGTTQKVLWQSFDEPTDTLLPGMKLGVNHKNGRPWSLTSWLNEVVPVPGQFSLEWDPKGRQLIIRRQGVEFWTSGVLKGGKFEFISDEYKSMYNFTIVSNEDEEHLVYNNINQGGQSAWFLSFEGKLLSFDGSYIAETENCNGHSTDGGCMRWLPSCRSRDDMFDKRSGYFIQGPEPSSFDYNTKHTMNDCRVTCWNLCGCDAYTFLYDNQTGCKFWEKKGEFFQDLSGTKKWIWVIGIAIGVIPLVVIFFCILCHLSRRRNVFLQVEMDAKSDDGMLELMNSDTFTTVNELQNDRKQGNDLRIFSYKCIMSATNNFSLENKLGEGGFGLVYKGIFSQGQEVAIKRLSRNSGQGMLEFKNELILISELQHMNLVQLLGFCIHGEERMLIYEYMPNKSLDYFLFDSTKSKMLDWPTRFSIIEGIAQGLLYLHKYSRLRVIHRDLKASNILLDENMNPKISDFGMARIFQQNELEANTRRIMGTYGYMSPEYAMEGVFSIKSDVYSFGVLLLEIMSGRKSNNFYHTKHLDNLVGYAWELWKEDAMLDLMDPTLSDSFIKDQMFRCIHVGLLCVGDSAIDRPTMSDVIAMLANDSLTLPSPEKPIFSRARKAIEAHICEKELENYSIYGLSISNMVAR
ncbi:G-type lectin S-receptor-like serine/threonine-protein kinase CES101 isoform X2 [Quercus robur]|uniref:G-type lectin S-receptor-like serine/threonine-protein kinase CES101 isoform X2 n=1 Tax=Quercus robur TaxID=38942 RepID=UPI0021625D04|nr:G-type lectin S-receptor-like serine/threonine-protein kinase CES101 isoform X2 [Quercus robur]